MRTKANHDSIITANASVGQKFKWIMISQVSKSLFDFPSLSSHHRAVQSQHHGTEHISEACNAGEPAAANRRDADRQSSDAYVQCALLNILARIERLQFVQFQHRTLPVSMPVEQHKHS